MTDGLSLRAAARLIRTEGQFNDSDFNTASPTFGFIIDSPGTGFTNEAIYALAAARLDPAAALEFVSDPGFGGITLFVGRVRDLTGLKVIARLQP